MKTRLAGIEYVGIAGTSADCKDAVIRLLQYRTRVTLGRILSHSNHHCLLITVDSGDLVAVKSGFASGYSGEGPRTFSFVLQLLEAHGADLEEYAIDEKLLNRLDMSALTRADISRIDAARPIRPSRWPDYVLEDDWKRSEDGTLWRLFKPIIPYAIIDPRIIDLALKFDEQPDDALLKGYRRLEDSVRERTGIDEHGARLFSQAFLTPPPKLTWRKIDESERVGRASLFTSAFMAYRNPRAHREPNEHVGELAEFLLLNHLFILESEAVDRNRKRRRSKDPLKMLLKKASSSKWKHPRK